MTSAAVLQTGTRVPRLDGIRALAFAMVFATHAGLFGIGWAGVQLFFVLSGLFITGILRRSRDASSYWPPFYLRRATRILPPLLIAFICAAMMSSVSWRKVGLLELLFLANVAETLYRGHTGTLGVLWSLAVEEQFYFVWPLAVRFLNRTQLIKLLIVIFIAEPVLRGFATPLVSSFWPIFF
jgi:peptidoglycan/LPS O-acetylase OafA/YrhL